MYCEQLAPAFGQLVVRGEAWSVQCQRDALFMMRCFQVGDLHRLLVGVT